MNGTSVTIIPNDGSRPDNLLADAEVVFHEGHGPFDGLKLVGFSIWRAPDGETYVTLPARAFGTAKERRYFDYIRSISGQHKETGRLKAFVHDAWRQFADAHKEA